MAAASSVTACKRTPPRPSRLYKSCAHRRRRGYNLSRGEAAAVARKNLFYEAVPDDLDSHSYIYHVLTHAFYCFVVVVLLAFYILYAVRPLTRSSRYRNKFCENVSARGEQHALQSHDDKKPVLVVCRYIYYITFYRMKTTRGHHLHTSYIYTAVSPNIILYHRKSYMLHYTESRAHIYIL